MGASLGMEKLGPVLERSLGFVALAPWFLLDACLAGFVACLSATVLAFSHERYVRGVRYEVAPQQVEAGASSQAE